MEKKPRTEQSNNLNRSKIRNIRDEIRIFRPKEDSKKDFNTFYKELDHKRKSKTPFVTSMVFILIILFAVIVYGLWLLKISLTGTSIFSGTKNDNQYLTTEVGNAISGKKTGDLINVEISEKELSEFIGVGGNDFPLKKSSLRIKPEAINISGRIGSSFFALPVTIKCLAKAEDGTLKIEIDNNNSGLAMFPKSLKDSLNTYFDDTISTYTSDIGRIKVEEVVLKDKKLILIGTAL